MLQHALVAALSNGKAEKEEHEGGRARHKDDVVQLKLLPYDGLRPKPVHRHLVTMGPRHRPAATAKVPSRRVDWLSMPRRESG